MESGAAAGIIGALEAETVRLDRASRADLALAYVRGLPWATQLVGRPTWPAAFAAAPANRPPPTSLALLFAHPSVHARSRVQQT